MGIFGNGKELKKLKAQVSQLQHQNNTSLSTSVQAVFPKWEIKSVPNRYCDTDDIYSIVKRLAQTSAMIPMYPYYEKNESAARKLKQFNPNDKPWQVKSLMTKALEDLPETDPVYSLLENPSPTLSKYEFYEAAYSMLYLHGECLIYKERGEVRNAPIHLHILFPQFVVLNVTRTWPQHIVSYDYVIDGVKVISNIQPDDIIHIRYFNPNFSINGTELRGLSPLRVLANRLTMLDSNLNVSVAQMQNGGVNTIVYMEDLQDAEISVLNSHKDNFYRFAANSANSGSVYWAGGKMQAIPLGLKLADMEIEALGKTGFKKLCNAYSVSDRLFNNDATGSEVSDDNSRKALYTDAALPNVFRLAGALQSSLNKDFPDKKRVISADITGIPELQENYKDLAIWLSSSWWITPNEKRDMMKFDRYNTPEFDEPMIPAGLQTIADLAMVPDLDNPANDYGDGS